MSGPRSPLQCRGPAFEPPVDRRAPRTKTDIHYRRRYVASHFGGQGASLASVRWFRSRPRPMRGSAACVSGTGARDRGFRRRPRPARRPPNRRRDDVSAPAAHSRPELLPKVRIACIMFAKRSCAITPSASERRLSRSSCSTVTVASYPGERAQAKLDACEGRKHNIQLGFASRRLAAMGDALISQSTGRSAATFCPNGGSATLSSMWS